MKLQRTIGEVLLIVGAVVMALGAMFWVKYPWGDGGGLVMLGLMVGLPMVILGALVIQLNRNK